MAHLKNHDAVMKRLIVLLLLYFPLAVAAAVSEEEDRDRWFDVEILLFTVDNEDAVAMEHWPENPGMSHGDEAIELAPALLPDLEAPGSEDEGQAATPPVIPYQLLPQAEQHLVAVENKLALSGDFTPFFHIAWRQPAFSREETGGAVHIHWEEQEGIEDSVPEVSDSLTAPPHFPLSTRSELFRSESSRQRAWLDGLITVSVNRYLHFDVDLLYDQAHGEAGQSNFFGLFSLFNGERSPHLFRIQQNRRLRSGELQYFDHPRFGMIALVTPYEYPQPAVVEEGESEGEETEPSDLEAADEVSQ